MRGTAGATSPMPRHHRLPSSLLSSVRHKQLEHTATAVLQRIWPHRRRPAATAPRSRTFGSWTRRSTSLWLSRLRFCRRKTAANSAMQGKSARPSSIPRTRPGTTPRGRTSRAPSTRQFPKRLHSQPGITLAKHSSNRMSSHQLGSPSAEEGWAVSGRAGRHTRSGCLTRW